VVEPLASNRDRQQSGHTGGVCCRWGAFFFYVFPDIDTIDGMDCLHSYIPKLMERMEVAYGYEASCILCRSLGILITLRFTAMENSDKLAEDTS
jgi:hypothetical protein